MENNRLWYLDHIRSLREKVNDKEIQRQEPLLPVTLLSNKTLVKTLKTGFYPFWITVEFPINKDYDES